ncbi:O-antigen ligase family protein [Plesiomonas shigelloides]|uniref:O-antigen ligase family protein n=1 Tax=Plesiomonas shigelloides TaxID=703 RepID=UPI0022482257|nr:O-antigen ligase family protein [Plesiomonas shigelloides]MCX2533825.1 O-antigen ligase family protein [Plesiomonas shigelloides]
MISSLVYGMPFFFCFSFMTLLGFGPSLMSKIIIFSAVIFFCLNYKKVIINFLVGWGKYNKFILSISFFALSSLVFHQLHGDYMEVVRAIFYFILIALCTGFFYKEIPWRWVEFSLVIGAISISLHSSYEYFILGHARVGAYINEIIFAQAVFSIFFLNFILFIYNVKVKYSAGAVLHLLSSFLCLASIIWSGTRGVWVALPVSLVLCLCYLVHNGVKIATIVKFLLVCVLALIVLFGRDVSLRYYQAKNDITMAKVEQDYSASSLGGRLYVWKAALMMATEHPLLGVGRDRFEQRISEYVAEKRIEPQQQVFPHAHNGYLNALAMNGVVGLCSYILFMISPILLIGNRRLFSLSSLSLLSLVISYAIFSLTDVPFIYQINIYMYLFSVVLLLKIDDRIAN